MRVNVNKLIREQEATQEQVHSITESTQSLERDVNDLLQIHFNIAPLLINDDLIVIRHETVSQYLSSPPPSYQTTQSSVDTCSSIASNEEPPLVHQKPNLCFPGREPQIPDGARWSSYGMTVAGGNDIGACLNQLNRPNGIYVDDDMTVYVADFNNNRIVAWSPNATAGVVVADGLSNPTDVTVDKHTDSLIICDRGNRRVISWPRQNGTRGDILIENIRCWGIAIDDNQSLYITDDDKHEVRRYDRGDTTGTVVAGGNGKGDHLNQLNWPRYVSVDTEHAVYVSDNGNHRVMHWPVAAKEGVILAGGQGTGSSAQHLWCARGVILDSSGIVYVAEGKNHRVTRWLNGNGSVAVGGNGRGDGVNQFNDPDGLCFDLHGNLYVADRFNHRVQRFSILKNT